MILRVRRKFFEITTFPNSDSSTGDNNTPDSAEDNLRAGHLVIEAWFRGYRRSPVGERSNFKKIPTHTQDHGDA